MSSDRKTIPPTSIGNLDRLVSPDDIEVLFQLLLKRPVNDEAYKGNVVAHGTTLRQFVEQIRGSEELAARVKHEIEVEHKWELGHAARRTPVTYRVPEDLQVTPLAVHRILLLGSCLMEQWLHDIQSFDPALAADFYLVGGNLPQAPLRPIDEYDFQVVQLPLRFVLPDASFARLSQSDLQGHEALFDQACGAVDRLLESTMRWNRQHGLLSFVFSFMVPQQNMVGRLMPRYDLRNPVFFVEKLNESLANALGAYPNAYFFDFNEIAGTFGRRFVHEEMISLLNHGGQLSDFDFEHDRNRLEPSFRATELYERKFPEVAIASWHELTALYRTTRQMDLVKLVVIDLDDTLWRGVIGETDVNELGTSEGWPKAFWETLTLLKRRGVLLAIISKNDEARVEAAWPDILGHHLALEDFAIRRINWRSKAVNMAEVLAAVNVLPGNVVFIDDNPVQREEIREAFPGIRVLGGTPIVWRHILLWAAETQVAGISAESGARTQMVQAQQQREADRRVLSRDEFLASLRIRMRYFDIDDVRHPRFARALELLNKTNQFNTTGARWTLEACAGAFEAATRFRAFEVADRYTDYGLVGLLVIDATAIQQFVMSCRVIGLDAELAAVNLVIEEFRDRGIATIRGALVETDRNLPCRDLYARSGFVLTGAAWQRGTTGDLVQVPHVERVPA